MAEIIITAGEEFYDLDTLACAIAYQELLRKKKVVCQAVLAGEPNASVVPEIKQWSYDLRASIKDGNHEYVIIDESNPKIVAAFVDQDKIIELYDHRAGMETYWNEKLGDKAKIEPVGACATLIWEEYKSHGLAEKISHVSANLLYTAIISNTLNFKASVTDQRDIEAFNELKAYLELPDNWTEIYFNSLEREVHENPRQSVINDTKKINYAGFETDLVIGQLELWNSKSFIDQHLQTIESALKSFGSDYWFLTSPSISGGNNYIYTQNPEVKQLLTRILDIKFEEDLGETSKLWLRKEILKKLQETN